MLLQCTCPTQFPMVRVGENGKYKVGDKLIIFVRILRRHIMVRVGGGWQELSEFLRVKDPCRSKSPLPYHNHNQHNHLYHQNPPLLHNQLQNVTSTQTQNIPNNNNNNNHHHSLLPKLVSTTNSRSRLGESSYHLNKGHQQHQNNNSNHQSYRGNIGGQRQISGSASMSWLSNNS